MKTKKLLVFSTAALMIASSALAFTACGDSCEHNYSWAETTPATCETAGVETGTCDKCGDKTTRNTNALGHSWTWTAEAAPTETAGGTLSAVCSKDASHKVNSHSIPALGSAYTKISETAASYTAPKTVTYKYTDSTYGEIQFTAVYGEKLTIANVEDALDAVLDGKENAGKAVTSFTDKFYVGSTLNTQVTGNTYEFGDEYTHVQESEHMNDYAFYVNGELFIVQDQYGDLQLLDVEEDGKLVEGFNFGSQYSFLSNYDVYGAENLLVALYDYADTEQPETLETNVDETQEGMVYSFSFSIFEKQEEGVLDSDSGKYVFVDSLSTYAVSFTMDESCTLQSLTVRADYYKYRFNGETNTDRSAFDADACPIEGYDTQEYTGKDVEHEYSTLEITQISKTDAAYEEPVLPAKLEGIIFDEIDLWLVEEVSETEYNEAGEESATLKKYTTSEYENASILVHRYYLGTPVAEGATLPATTAAGLTLVVDAGDMNDYLGLNNIIVTQNGKQIPAPGFEINANDVTATKVTSTEADYSILGQFTIRSKQFVGKADLVIKSLAAEFSFSVNFTTGAPESLNPAFSQYNEYTEAYTWNSTASSATVYAGSELKVKAEAVVSSDYKLDDSFTAAVTSANAADATLNWNAQDEVYVFSAPAGTYEITFTSKVSASATGTLTVEVLSAPDVAEMLAGEYMNTKGTVHVTFAGGKVTIDDSTGVGTVTTIYDVAYTGGQIVLTGKEGAGDYSIEVNELYHLVLVSDATKHVLIEGLEGLEPQQALAGTTWITTYNGGEYDETFYIYFNSESLLTAHGGNVDGGEQYTYTLTEDGEQAGKYNFHFEWAGTPGDEEWAGYYVIFVGNSETPDKSNTGSYVEFDGIHITNFVVTGDYYGEKTITVTYEQVTPEAQILNSLKGTTWEATYNNGSEDCSFVLNFLSIAEGQLTVYDVNYDDVIEHYDFTLTEGEDGKYMITFTDSEGFVYDPSDFNTDNPRYSGIDPSEEGSYLIWNESTETVTSFVTSYDGSLVTFTRSEA